MDAVEKGVELGTQDLSRQLRRFGREIETDEAIVGPDKVKAKVEEMADQFASSVVQVTGEQIRAAIQETIDQGQTFQDLSKRLADLGQRKKGKETDRIARTEMSNALNGGAQMSWQESGVKKNEWLASVDACQFCKKLNGRQVGVGKAFVSKGENLTGTDGGTMKAGYKTIDGPTLHPQCRCTVIPVVEDL